MKGKMTISVQVGTRTYWIAAKNEQVGSSSFRMWLHFLLSALYRRIAFSLFLCVSLSYWEQWSDRQ